jgi:hypothetical protein
MNQAYQRAQAFWATDTASPMAISLGTLFVDSFVLAKDWPEARALALRTREWSRKDIALKTKLTEVAAQATVELLSAAQQAHAWSEAQKEIDFFNKAFPKDRREKDVLATAVQVCLSADRLDAARGYVDRLIQEYPKTPEGIDAYRVRAEFEENGLDYLAASQDLRRYFLAQIGSKSGDVAESIELRKKALFLAWMSGDAAEMKHAIEFGPLCDSHLKEECELYQGLSAIDQQSKFEGKEAEVSAREKAQNGSNEHQLVWSVAALSLSSRLNFEQKFRLIDAITEVWQKSDPLTRFAVYPTLIRATGETLEARLQEIRKQAPMQKQPAWIRQRTALLEKFEKRTDGIEAMGWSRFQVQALASVAQGYFDFLTDVESFTRSATAGLSDEEAQSVKQALQEVKNTLKGKIDDFGLKGLEIARKNAVEGDETSSLVALLSQNATDRKDVVLPPQDVASEPRPQTQWLNEVEGADTWALASLASHELPRLFRGRFVQVVQSNHFAIAAYLLKIAQEKHWVSTPVMSLAQLIVFDGLGARSEALQAFEFQLDQWPSEHVGSLLKYDVGISVHALSKERTSKALGLIDQFWRKSTPFHWTPSEARLLLYAAAWVKFDLPNHLTDLALALSKSDAKPASVGGSP